MIRAAYTAPWVRRMRAFLSIPWRWLGLGVVLGMAIGITVRCVC